MLGIDLRACVVTGGSRGVGRAVALMLAAPARRWVSRTAAATRMPRRWSGSWSMGVPAWSHAGDLSSPARSERCSSARATSSAGSTSSSATPASGSRRRAGSLMSDEQWRARWHQPRFHLLLHARGARIMSDDGRIVLISSTAGQRGEAGHADYAASKGALISFVKGVAVELAAQGITVNCVAPGWIDTEMAAQPYAGEGRSRIEAAIPLGRVASPRTWPVPSSSCAAPRAPHHG
jgi:3-oxoacyl-[acyl-carrier protein] reductase